MYEGSNALINCVLSDELDYIEKGSALKSVIIGNELKNIGDSDLTYLILI